MSPVAFAIAVGALEGLFFFWGTSWLLANSASTWQKASPFIVGAALPIAMFVGWRSFKSVLDLTRPGTSFWRTLTVGTVSGGVMGSVFILLVPLFSQTSEVTLHSYLHSALPVWLFIGATLGLLIAAVTWVINAGMVRLSGLSASSSKGAEDARSASALHNPRLVLGGLLITELVIVTCVHLWYQPDQPVSIPVPEVAITTNAKGLQGALHRGGREVIPHQFAYVGQISPRFFLVRAVPQPGDKTPKFGIWSAEGQQVIEPKYRDIRHVALHQRFRVSLGDENPKFGYFDEDGREVLPVVYDHLERISNLKGEPTNVALRGDGYGYVDIRTGEVLIEPKYDTFQVTEDMIDADGKGILLARYRGNWGVIDTRGHSLTDFVFDELDVLNHDTLRGKQADQVHTFKFHGDTIQP
jgi:hypothetical protein